MAEITYFDFDRSKLSESDRKTVSSLVEAAKAIHRVWEKQSKNGKLTVYPEDATKEELLKAAKDDPSILDGYTVVERDGDGFKTTPYHEAYAEDLEEFHKHMQEAAKHTEEKDLKEYIAKYTEACKKGDYKAALAAYLLNPNTRVEFLGGPLEVYEDQLLGRKHTFQFNVRVLKSETSEEVEDMVDIIKNIKLPQPETSMGTKLEESKINIRLDDVVLFAGRQAGILISSTNLPNEPELIEQYGTKVTVYTTSMNEKFDKRHVPLLPFFDDIELDKKVDEMKLAMFRLIALHEIAEASMKFKGMEERLGSRLTPVRELNADLAGLDSAKYHLLNGLISLDEYKEIISAFFVFAIDLVGQYEKSDSLVDYAKGFAVAFNFFERSGSVEFEKDEVDIDFAKISKDIETLSNLTMSILEEGDEKDADTLFDEYGSFDIFERIPLVEIQE